MNKLLFLDVETTGLNEEDRICEVSFAEDDGTPVHEYIKPPLPIKTAASAVNHITDKMVADAPAFADSSSFDMLQEMALSGQYIIVAHNAPFDMKMLDKEGVHFDEYIDTKKLSHALDDDDTMESHRLQFLRYYYSIEMPEATAHTAEGDVAVLREVYKVLVNKLGDPTVDELIETSSLPVLHKVFRFGKYKGQKIEDVMRTDMNYCQWLWAQKKNSDEDETDWLYTLDHYFKQMQ